jgi:hypothetical protein
MDVALLQARSMWRGQPFKAGPSDQPLTAPLPVKLATEGRACERQEFDRHMEEKMAAAEVGARQPAAEQLAVAGIAGNPAPEIMHESCSSRQGQT